MKNLIKALFLGTFLVTATSTVQAQTVEVYPVQQFWGPVVHEVCTEYRRVHYDPYHNFLNEDFYTTCIFPDGTVQTYTPDVYRTWGWYPQIVITPFGFLHGHDHDHGPFRHRR